jgi:hypothetical protein
MIVVAGTHPQLPRLPAPRIAPAVEARDYDNAILLKLEKYAVGEAPHSRTSPVR